MTNLETQAVRLWAQMTAGSVSDDEDDFMKSMAAFMSCIVKETDDELAKMLLTAKHMESKAGRRPMSAEPIPQ